jgi:signal transduction histidine kinase
MPSTLLDAGELQFTVDARILRELGERLVRRPETALIELIKNAYDADATECAVEVNLGREIRISDDGHGMTFNQFRDGWMRIGTASKAVRTTSPKYDRPITGEKGIGRFSVRFLGQRLQLETTAYDDELDRITLLTARFDWPAYDESEDIGAITIPYELRAADAESTGTTLLIGALRPPAAQLNLRQVRTASIGLVSPLQSLIVRKPTRTTPDKDPGFRLVLGEDTDDDLATRVLDAYTLRATLFVRKGRLQLQVLSADSEDPYFKLVDTVPARCGDIEADIRFFPRRAGAFRGLGIDGRRAYTWIKDNSGVAVFDRDFRVSPYGEAGDDWLALTADAARNRRQPRSSVASKHFPMSEAEERSTADNWMLRLPESAQLIGVVQVAGMRGLTGGEPIEGLVAAADREGFIANDAFTELVDLVRGAVEVIAMCDRRQHREKEERERRERLRRLQEQAAAAAAEIESNKAISASEKKRLINAITEMATEAEAHEQATEEKVRQLEVMSLLGVIAGFMTHEFGVALDQLDIARRILSEQVDTAPAVKSTLERLDSARARLGEFTDYSSAYIRGGRSAPDKAYPALPRLRLVRKTFGHYADERHVEIETQISKDLTAPRVPTALYDGVLLNLLTNALKAVTSVTERTAKRVISFRAWNERGLHYLEAADTGVGIPAVLRERVFDPLFTTTASRNDPLGSGMGLGLAVVRASVEAFGGTVRVVDPPNGFSTCVQVRLPLEPGDE